MGIHLFRIATLTNPPCTSSSLIPQPFVAFHFHPKADLILEWTPYFLPHLYRFKSFEKFNMSKSMRLLFWKCFECVSKALELIQDTLIMFGIWVVSNFKIKMFPQSVETLLLLTFIIICIERLLGCKMGEK